MSLVLNSGGLGVMYKVDSAGNVVDCDSLDNIFQSVCWNPAAATVQATTSTVTNSDGTTTTVLAPATSADVTTPGALCNFFDCDSSGNLELDATNLLWFGGIAIALTVALKALKII